MTDHAAFLAAIIARPDADAPRLVYADWLEERGDPRGEFIRVQIELAKAVCACEGCAAGRCGTNCGVCSKQEALRRRERELLAIETKIHDTVWDNKHLWARGPLTDRGDTDWAFRRGFVEEITCDWPTWGGGPCRACNQTGVEHRDNNGNVWTGQCSTCHGAAVTDGHSAAIRASTPLRKCKLTTRPEGLGITDDTIMQVLGEKWPGVEFELPNPNCHHVDIRMMDESVPYGEAEFQRDLRIIHGDPTVPAPRGILFRH